jgi:hypothetical protein
LQCEKNERAAKRATTCQRQKGVTQSSLPSSDENKVAASIRLYKAARTWPTWTDMTREGGYAPLVLACLLGFFYSPLPPWSKAKATGTVHTPYGSFALFICDIAGSASLFSSALEGIYRRKGDVRGHPGGPHHLVARPWGDPRHPMVWPAPGPPPSLLWTPSSCREK